MSEILSGTVTRIEFTRSSFGEQRTYIDGKMHVTWWDFNRFRNMREGATVKYRLTEDTEIHLGGDSKLILKPCAEIIEVQ